MLLALSCDRKQKPDADALGLPAARASARFALPAEREAWVPLRGDFETLVKPVTGRADIVLRDGKYLLYLTGVSVDAKPPLRVYLVGQQNARTTRSVNESEQRYDMAELDNGAPEQIIALPSRPDPALRSVVIWQAAFAVNLAVAPLRPVRGDE